MDDLNAVTLELLRMFSGRAFHNSVVVVVVFIYLFFYLFFYSFFLHSVLFSSIASQAANKETEPEAGFNYWNLFIMELKVFCSFYRIMPLLCL